MDRQFKQLWVDDTRPCPDGWDYAPTAHEALVKLELIPYEEVSLDHDLGCFYGNTELTGYNIALWLVQRKHDGKYIPPTIRCHSANIVGKKNIEDVLDRYLPDHKG